MRSHHKIYINHENKNEIEIAFPIKILSENFNIEFVKSLGESDLIIDFVNREKNNDLDYRYKKYLVIAGDNLYFRKNLFSFVESFFHKVAGNKKYKIMDFLNKIIPKKISEIPISSFFPKYDKIINDALKEKEKNYFFVTTNNIKHKNFVSIPLFIQDYFYDLKKLQKKKIPSDKELQEKKFCAFVVSSNSSRERVDFFKKLSKYKKVDSYGKVMNNVGDLIQKKDWKSNSDLFKEYKFVICFENSFSEDYITEKLPNVMFANSIPIYRGAPNEGKYFNTKSFINYEDYGSYEKMIEKIIELDNDDEKYKEFLKQPWFKDNKIPAIINNKKEELVEFYKKILK